MGWDRLAYSGSRVVASKVQILALAFPLYMTLFFWGRSRADLIIPFLVAIDKMFWQQLIEFHRMTRDATGKGLLQEEDVLSP